MENNGILKDYYDMDTSPLQKALRKRRKKMGKTLDMKVPLYDGDI